MIPKTKDELELYFKLLELYDLKKRIESFPSPMNYGKRASVERYGELKEEYLKLANK